MMKDWVIFSGLCTLLGLSAAAQAQGVLTTHRLSAVLAR
jgi:hypothetical protein